MKLLTTGLTIAFAMALTSGTALASTVENCIGTGDVSHLGAGYDGADLVRQGSFERDGVRLKDGNNGSSFGHIKGRPAIGATNVIYMNPTNRTKACREAAEAEAAAAEAEGEGETDQG